MSLSDYLSLFGDQVISLLLQHIMLFGIAMVAATVLGIAAGIAVARLPVVAAVLVPIMNVLQACPELVLMALAIPLLGVGIEAALVPLFIKGVLPILRNTVSALGAVDPRMREAAAGIGMTRRQIFWRVEMPVALPVIIAGMRVSAVMLVSVLTLTAYIGVDSLGTLIVQGIARMDPTPLLIGSVLTAALALLLNYGLLAAERLSARHLR